MTRGGAARLARKAHNLEVAGSNPAPATNLMTKSTIGYRILDYDGEVFKTLFHGLNGSRKLKTGRWLKAERKLVSDGTSNKRYESGFHILPSMLDCMIYARKFRHFQNRVLVKIKYRGGRPKEHSRHPVILADEMLIPHDAYFENLSVCLNYDKRQI